VQRLDLPTHALAARDGGVRPFGIGTDTPIGRMHGVDLGCREGASEEELSRPSISCVDGLHDRRQHAPAFGRHR